MKSPLAKPLALALTLVPAAALATVLVPLDTRALTERADRVVYGTVVAQSARWSSDHEVIFTEVTVKVARAYKGSVNPGELVTFRREGGSTGGIGMKVFGAAQFSVGEEVVLFLEQRGGASYTVGMAQGKLAVTVGSDGVRRVAPDLRGVAFTRAPDARTLAAQGPRRLDEVEREILSYARGTH